MASKTDTKYSQKDLEIGKELKRLATRRGTELSSDVYEVYTDDLRRFQLDDIEAALLSIGREPRKSFEKPFPEVGILIAECERQENMRRGASSPIRTCTNEECHSGMVRIFEGSWSRGVIACPTCGGPSWFKSSLDHNFFLLKENGLGR